MASPNTLQTWDIIAKRSLGFFYNSLGLAKMANREYVKEFSTLTGTTIRIRKPNRFIARTGATAVLQAIDEITVPLVCNNIAGVDLSFDSTDLTLRLDDWSERILQPAMITMANKVNIDMWATVEAAASIAVGTMGSPINSFARVNAATARLRGLGVQTARLYGGYSVTDSETLQNSLQNSFNEVLNKEISADAVIGRLAAQDMFYDQSVVIHNADIATGTPLVNTAAQTGATLITDGWTNTVTNILTAGALFVIDGVFEVNNDTYQSTGQLRTFHVDVAANSDGAGNATLTISPPIVVTGSRQNVTNSPANNAVITVITKGAVGAYANKNVVFNPDGFTLAVVPLDLPDGAVFKKRMTDPELNISIRAIQYYDGGTDINAIRYDCLYGMKCFDDYVCMVLS